MKIQEKHLLFISIPAYGHAIPLLELARKISKFHQVTFAVSAKMAGDLPKRELFDAKADNRIKLYPIPDGIVDDMEDPNDCALFERIMPMMVGGIMEFVEKIPTSSAPSLVSEVKELTRPVDGIVTDNFVGFAAESCSQRNIPLYIFNSSPAAFTWMILSAHSALKTMPMADADGFLEMPDKEGNFTKPIPHEFLHYNVLPMQKVLPSARAVIVNSVHELENEVIKRCQNKPGMKDVPFFCIGPVLLAPKEGSNTNAMVEQKVSKWLDEKDRGSVVYISFGTVVVLTPAQMGEIVKAIRQLGRPVIWSLKVRNQPELPEDLKTATNLDDPSSKLLVLSWAPQKKILSHQNVGVFVSHCGWNSTLEGLAGGKPIVGWPQFAEQLMNAEFVAEIGAGEVIHDAGSKNARVVPATEIVNVINRVQRKMSDGARAFQKKLYALMQPEGSSQEFEELVAYIGRS
ncbi:hypothetical protein RvY_10538 [Ramazzottius varieornatus]|uniref:UDP-glucuronosyltransferase n=1 Tax=Ramazzottius varieornatus TaxID=947166 RepID=A0A1D1VHK4_RAMVA|nr:hypothetical protein RvY_10538 [Ramazzottius varieornatus]